MVSYEGWKGNMEKRVSWQGRRGKKETREMEKDGKRKEIRNRLGGKDKR